MIHWWRTDFDEADAGAVADAVRNRCLSQGKITREFEERLAETLGVPYVVCTTSGTTALTMAVLAAGVGAGDDVIVPNRTWIATAHAVMMTGARVLLCDVEKDRPILDCSKVEALFGRNDKAIIPVYLNGNVADQDELDRFDDNCGRIIIEDACQAFPWVPRGIAACYSFSTAKLIPTGQGGAVATRDQGLYDELRAIRTHDVPDAMIPVPLQWKRFGYNFRYTDLQASIGLVQLSRLKQKTERLQEIRALYAQGLPPWLTLLPCDGVPLYTECLHPDPEPLRAYLHANGIESRPAHPSLHTAAYLKPPHRAKYHDYEFPNSQRFARGLTLPSGPAQTNADIRRVLEVLNAYQ